MDSLPVHKVLVYGATGSQAAPVVYELLRRGHRPFAVTRNTANAASLRAAGAEIVVADMADRARLLEISRGMDAVALLIPFFSDPAVAPEFGRNAIDAARAAGVGLLVWNTSGLTPPAATGNPAIDVRLTLTEYLRASGVPHVIIQPTAYAENLLGPWTAPFIATSNTVRYPTPPHVRVGWIAAADVGALIVAALERPALTGRSFQVSGIENPDGPELAAAFAAALGRPIQYQAMPPAEFGAILDRVFGPGAGAGAASEYERLWSTGEFPRLHVAMDAVLAELPVRMRTVREWVAEHADAFSAARELGR